MNAIFYDVLKLKFRKDFDQHCYAACFETIFSVRFLSPPKTYKPRDYKRKFTV